MVHGAEDTYPYQPTLYSVSFYDMKTGQEQCTSQESGIIDFSQSQILSEKQF
jgi:hypothetical protein